MNTGFTTVKMDVFVASSCEELVGLFCEGTICVRIKVVALEHSQILVRVVANFSQTLTTPSSCRYADRTDNNKRTSARVHFNVVVQCTLRSEQH